MRKYGILILAFLGFAGSCNKSGVIQNSQVFQLAVVDSNGNVLTDPSLPADNFSYATLRAHVDSTVIDTTTSFTFTTDNGNFSTGGTTAMSKIDFHGNAYVYLKSKVIIAAHVQATVAANYSQNITIQFVTSYPDALYLNLPDSATDDLAGRISFTTTLYKHKGSVSPGLIIGYNAMTAGWAPIGKFPQSLPSDSTGTASAQFWLDSASYTGFIQIQAFLVLGANDSIKTSAVMLITH